MQLGERQIQRGTKLWINFEYIETNVENGIVDCLKNRHVIKRNHEEYTAV